MYFIIYMLNVIGIDHDVSRTGACSRDMQWMMEGPLSVSCNLRGDVCVCVCVLLWVVLRGMRCYPPYHKSYPFWFWNTAWTISLMPYLFLKTKDITICECLCFLFSPANEEKSYISPFFPLCISRSRGWESSVILLLLSTFPLLVLAPQSPQPVHTPFAS